MLCKKPFQNFACGQCMPCRIARRRLWSHRMVLESYKHDDNSFLTLTYDAEHLPVGGTLVPRDAQLFLKRLRKAIAPRSLRYFLCGEYGDQTFRPHYHAILFGVSPSDLQVVQKSWSLGHVVLGDFTPATASYVCGYTVKKMTKADDPRLLGRHPEFARMSLRPGIGAVAMHDVALTLSNGLGAQLIIRDCDVPTILQHGSKKMPLGRYLRKKLRASLGLTEVLNEDEVQISRSKRMSVMYPVDEPATKAQKILNLENRTKIFNSRRTL